MAARPYRSLAPELIDMIFEELEFSVRATEGVEGPTKREYREAMRCCLLVSMPFRHRAARILFYHVEISKDSPENGSLALLRQIITPPDPSLEGVGRYIESLSISYKHSPEQKYSLFGQDCRGDLQEFLGNQDLIAVMNALRGENFGIKRLAIDLSISSIHRMSRRVSWHKIEPKFRDALQNLASSPRLRYLSMSDVHDVPLALLNDTNVQYVRLCNSGFDSQAGYTRYYHTGIESGHPILEAVFHHDTTASQQCLQLLKVPNKRAALRRLTEVVYISHGEEQMHEMWSIVRAAAETLEVISIEHNSKLAYPFAAFSLSHIPNLVSFSYTQKYMNSMDESGAALGLARIHSILNLDRPMQRLEIMKLHIQSQSIGVPRNTIDPEAADQWRRIAELLAGPHYATLREVIIDIVTDVIVDVQTEDFEIDDETAVFNEWMTDKLHGYFETLARSKAGFHLSVDTWVSRVL